MPESKKKVAAPGNDGKLSDGWDAEAAAKQDEDEGWGEIESDFVQFVKVGDSVSGRLIDKSTQTMRGNAVGRYQVETDGGEHKTFLGGTDIDAKLKLVEVGTQIKVRFVGTTSTKGGQTMKRFQVLTR